MQCNICHALVPPGATECPNCGIPTSYMYASHSDASPAREQPTEQVPFVNRTAPPASGGPQEASPASYTPFTYQPAVKIFPSPPARPSRRTSPVINALAILLFIMLFLLVGGFAYYALVVQPATMRADATATAQALATQAIVTGDPGALYNQETGGSPTIADPLNNKASSSWGEYSGVNGACTFTSGTYHITSLQAGLTACFYKTSSFRNFAFQVQMTIVKGDAGGLIFRLPTTNSQTVNAYMFTVNVIGTYSLVSTASDVNAPLTARPSSAIAKGVNHTNLLTVIARGNSIYLYVNKQYVASIKDNRYADGRLGMLALNLHDPSEVAFSNAQIWKL
jgi:hypothetical protein